MCVEQYSEVRVEQYSQVLVEQYPQVLVEQYSSTRVVSSQPMGRFSSCFTPPITRRASLIVRLDCYPKAPSSAGLEKPIPSGGTVVPQVLHLPINHQMCWDCGHRHSGDFLPPRLLRATAVTTQSTDQTDLSTRPNKQ